MHRGFLASYNAVRDIIPDVQSLTLKYPNKRVFCTGHSLGGAIAQLVALELRSLGMNASIYTFGSPRVGNKNFADYFNNAIKGDNFRITYSNDPVPTVPPNSLGFYHTGTQVHYTSLARYSVLPIYYDYSPSWKFNVFDHSNYKYILQYDILA